MAGVPAYKAMAYEAAAKCGRQRGREVDEVVSKLRGVGWLLAALLLGGQHPSVHQLQGEDAHDVLAAGMSSASAPAKELKLAVQLLNMSDQAISGLSRIVNSEGYAPDEALTMWG